MLLNYTTFKVCLQPGRRSIFGYCWRFPVPYYLYWGLRQCLWCWCYLKCFSGAVWSSTWLSGWYRPSQKFVLQLWWLVQFNRLFSPPTSYQDEGGNADFRKKWMNFNMALKPQFLNYIWNTGTIKSNKKDIIYPDIQSQIFIFPLFSRDIKMKCISSQTLLLLHSLRLRVKTRKFICVPLGTYLT